MLRQYSTSTGVSSCGYRFLVSIRRRGQLLLHEQPRRPGLESSNDCCRLIRCLVRRTFGSMMTATTTATTDPFKWGSAGGYHRCRHLSVTQQQYEQQQYEQQQQEQQQQRYGLPPMIQNSTVSVSSSVSYLDHHHQYRFFATTTTTNNNKNKNKNKQNDDAEEKRKPRPRAGGIEERRWDPKFEAPEYDETTTRFMRKKRLAAEQRRQQQQQQQLDEGTEEPSYNNRRKRSEIGGERQRSGAAALQEERRRPSRFKETAHQRRFRPSPQPRGEEEDTRQENRYQPAARRTRGRHSRGDMTSSAAAITTRDEDYDEDDIDDVPSNGPRSKTKRFQPRERPDPERDNGENERWADDQRRPKESAQQPNVKQGRTFRLGDVLVLCHPGLERVLSSELTKLNIPHKPVKPTTNGLIGLNSSVSTETIMKLHMYLGSASHVVWELLSGNETYHSVRALGEIQRKVAQVPWRKILEFPPMTYKHKRKQIMDQRKERKLRASEGGDGGPDKTDKRDDVPGPVLYCKIKATASKSRILHTGAIQERIIMAINQNLKQDKTWKGEKVVLFKESEHERNNMPTAGTIISLEARVHYDMLRLWLNTSSVTVPLNRRGYRLAVAKAPLREDLAYAMLYNAGWIPRYDAALASIVVNEHEEENDQDSLPEDKKTMGIPAEPFDGFLDPFCGSGTLAIEAASMWAGLPPGRLRPPPLSGTQWHDPTLWQTMLERAMECARRRQRTETVKIACSDRDKGAMEAVESNAKRAGVWDMLTPWKGAFSKHAWLTFSKDNNTDNNNEDRPKNILIATNPPYGERLALNKKNGNNRHEQLLPMFQTLGTRLEQSKRSSSLSSYALAILVRDKNILKRACGGLEWDDGDNKLHFSNGNIFVTSMMTRSSTTTNNNSVLPLKMMSSTTTIAAAAEEDEFQAEPITNDVKDVVLSSTANGGEDVVLSSTTEEGERTEVVDTSRPESGEQQVII